MLEKSPYSPLWDPNPNSAAAHAMWFQHGDIPLEKCNDLPTEPRPSRADIASLEDRAIKDKETETKIYELANLYKTRLQLNQKLKRMDKVWRQKRGKALALPLPLYQEMQMTANMAFFTLHRLCMTKVEIAQIAQQVFDSKDKATYSYIILKAKSKALIQKDV